MKGKNMSDYNHGPAINLKPNLDLKDCLYKNCNQGRGKLNVCLKNLKACYYLFERQLIKAGPPSQAALYMKSETI